MPNITGRWCYISLALRACSPLYVSEAMHGNKYPLTPDIKMKRLFNMKLPVHVFLDTLGQIIVDDKLYVFYVNTPGGYSCSHEDGLTTHLEVMQRLFAFFLQINH